MFEQNPSTLPLPLYSIAYILPDWWNCQLLQLTEKIVENLHGL